MATLVLQQLVTLLLIGFGSLALLISRRMSGAPAAHRDSWYVAGAVFLVYSFNKLLQGIWGVSAFVAGAGADVYQAYLRASPMFNHSRTFLLFALYLLLAAIALRGPLGPRMRVGMWLTVFGTLGLGATYGYIEGALDAARHFSATAIIDTGGYIALAAVLLLLLLRDTVDRLLWFGLAAQGIGSIIGVLFLTAMAWVETPGSWSPPFWMIELFRLALVALMVSLAVARYRYALRGDHVGGMLPAPRHRMTFS